MNIMSVYRKIQINKYIHIIYTYYVNVYTSHLLYVYIKINIKYLWLFSNHQAFKVQRPSTLNPFFQVTEGIKSVKIFRADEAFRRRTESNLVKR